MLSDFALPEYPPELRPRLEVVIQAIVDALQAVVPAGMMLARQGLWAGVTERGHLVSACGFCQEVGARGLTTFAGNLANLVQDYVSRETTLPWPSFADDPTSMALPDAAVDDGVLTIWFGDGREPVITCAPIRIDGLLP